MNIELNFLTQKYTMFDSQILELMEKQDERLTVMEHLFEIKK